MRRKVLSERQQRVLANIRFLDAVGRSTLPITYTAPEDIERLLGLQAAGLVKAIFDPILRDRSGEARIPRAVVLCVTQEGFATLARTERENPGILSRFEEKPPKRRARKAMPASPMESAVVPDATGLGIVAGVIAVQPPGDRTSSEAAV